MRLGEQIQEGHSAANAIIEEVKKHLERLNNDKTAIACLRDELYTQLFKLIGEP